MTVTELDIYRAANLLIKEHGIDAPIQAAMKADEILDKGDWDGRNVWWRMMLAVEELLSEGPGPDDIIH